jgi:DNA-binding CsgD family transcriptional regulator
VTPLRSKGRAPQDLRIRRFVGQDGKEYAALWFSSRRGAPSLTPAEREVTSMILAGWSNEKIATARRVSLPTVAAQIRSIFSKVGVTGRAELVARLLE